MFSRICTWSLFAAITLLITLHCRGFTFSSPKVFLRKLLCSNVGGRIFRAKNSAELSLSNILSPYFWTFKKFQCWRSGPETEKSCPCWHPQINPHSFLCQRGMGWHWPSVGLRSCGHKWSFVVSLSGCLWSSTEIMAVYYISILSQAFKAEIHHG